MRLLFAVIACLGLAAPGHAAGRHELRRAWNLACKNLKNGRPREECAALVERALQQQPSGALHREVVERGLADIRAAVALEANLGPINTDTPPHELVHHLIDANLKAYHILPEISTRKQGNIGRVWVNATQEPEDDDTDPAIRLYKRGRAAIPALLDLLDDDAATRMVWDRETLHEPSVLMRRSDVAVSLIEAISGCRFNARRQQQPFHALDEQARAAVTDLVRQWWRETHDLSGPEAVSWLIDRAERREGIQMIKALLRADQRARARSHLQRMLPTENLSNADVVRLLTDLDDGSGLDHFHALVKGGATITRQAAEFFARYGGLREFRLLRQLVLDDMQRHSGATADVAQLVFAALGKTTNQLALPVYAVALGEEHPVDLRNPAPAGRQARPPTRGHPTAPWDSLEGWATQRLQQLSGRDFGFVRSDPLEQRRAAISRAHQWWEAEGRWLLGFDQATVRRRGGIR